jgi:tetratricopeptide (TPR) repeat protein
MKKISRFIIIVFFISFDFLVNAANTDYHNQGIKFFNLNNYKEAKFYFEKDIVFNIKNEKSYLYLSKIALIEKDKVQEKNYLDTVLVINPKNEEALYLKILLNVDEGDFKKAQESNLIFGKVCKDLCSKKTDLSKMIIVDKKK